MTKKIKIDYVITDDGKKRINLNFIRKRVPDYKEREIYICGPREMMKDIQ